jgi:2-acylglycerol O-acyltransferase 2
MYLVNSETENIYLKKRQNTVKVAIQEGAHIIPAFFFGNTRLFHVAARDGSDSLLAKLSRKLRASIVFFYGRQGLPVPFRQPIHMASGDIVEVVQNDNPSAEEVQSVLDRVVASVDKLYREKRPEWERRELVIS